MQYKDVVRIVLNEGRIEDSRLGVVKTVNEVMLPGLTDIKRPNMDKRISVVEADSMLMGLSVVDHPLFNSLSETVQKLMSMPFADYGLRMHPRRIQDAVDELKSDPKSRRVVVTVSREDDLPDDRPCIREYMYAVTGNNLHTTVIARSTDVMMGLPYDYLTASRISSFVAAELGLQPRPPLFFTNNLHMYQTDAHLALATVGSDG